MTELLPCPFCGGEAHTYKTMAQRYCAICNKPFCANVGPFDTEAEAITAWNTRAERVGERKTINKTGDFVTHDSRAERTCKMEYSGGVHEFLSLDTWTCSECGCEMYDAAEPNYCPNCGAKVVGE